LLSFALFILTFFEPVSFHNSIFCDDCIIAINILLSENGRVNLITTPVTMQGCHPTNGQAPVRHLHAVGPVLGPVLVYTGDTGSANHHF
jgi:hypothetical protein